MVPGSITVGATEQSFSNAVQGVSEKGITEKSFWSCADRGNARQYLSSMAEYSTGKAKAEAAETMKKRPGRQVSVQGMSSLFAWHLRIEIAETTASLAAAVIGAIPWGSWGASGEASVKETSTASREVSQEAEAVRQEEGERLAQRAAQRMVTSETHMFEVSKTVQKEALSKTIATSAQSILSGTATGLGYYQEFKENPEESAKGEKSPLKVAKEIKKKTLPDFEARPRFRAVISPSELSPHVCRTGRRPSTSSTKSWPKPHGMTACHCSLAFPRCAFNGAFLALLPAIPMSPRCSGSYPSNTCSETNALVLTHLDWTKAGDDPESCGNHLLSLSEIPANQKVEIILESFSPTEPVRSALETRHTQLLDERL